MGTPLVDAAGVGVAFIPEHRRDDVQTIAYRALRGRRRKRKFWALKDVSFAVEAGRVLGIIGGNGAGKSTLCRVLAGLIKPDTGQIVARGSVSALLSLGTGFNADLSGRENILLNGMMLGLSRRDIEALAPQIAEFSGLGWFVDQPLKSYSSGMRARLGFSIAAMIEPEILVLDETLSVGDIEFTARAGDRLRALMRRASLVIIVSHQLEFVTKYCTDVLWLDAGQVRAIGRPEETVELYRSSIQKIPPRPKFPLPRSEPRTGHGPAITVTDAGVRFELAPGGARRGKATRVDRGPHSPFWALDGVSFSVNEGEIVGIIGQNGAGKTTLCKVLAGVLKPDRGSAHVTGDVTAFLTMDAGFNQQLSGGDNIYLGGLILGRRRRDVRAAYDEIVEFSDLGPFIEEPVKYYSRGMRARLAFSTVTSIEPDTLIVDEALSAGDAAFSRKASERMEELIARARAVIVVTHNLRFVETVCTRAIWLQEGRLVFDGTPREAVERYRRAGSVRAGGVRSAP